MADMKTSSTDSEEKVVKKASTQRKTTPVSKTTVSKSSVADKNLAKPMSSITKKVNSTQTRPISAISARDKTTPTTVAKTKSSLSSTDGLDELKAARARKKAEEKLNAFASGDVTRGLKTSVRERASISDKDYVAPPIETKEHISKKPSSTNVVIEKPKVKKEKIKQEKVEKDEDVVDVIASTASVGRSRRNKLIITVLVVLIAVVWVFILFTRIMRPEEIKYNCYLYTSGNKVSATDIMIGGKEIDKWIIDEGIGPKAEYNDVLSVKIKQQGSYDIKFRIEVFKNKERVEEFGVVQTTTIFQQTTIEDEDWFVATNVSGKQTIILMTGITFFDVVSSEEVFGLNTDNLKMNIYVDVSQSA